MSTLSLPPTDSLSLSPFTLTRIRSRSRTSFTHEATSPEPDLHKLLAHISIYERTVQYELEQQRQRRSSASSTSSASSSRSSSPTDPEIALDFFPPSTAPATTTGATQPALQRSQSQYLDPAIFVAERSDERMVTVSTEVVEVSDDEVEEWE